MDTTTVNGITLVLLGAMICGLFFSVHEYLLRNKRYARLMDEGRLPEIQRVVINTGDILVVRYQDGFTKEQREYYIKAFSEATKGRFLLAMLSKDISIEAVLATGSPDHALGKNGANNDNNSSPDELPLSEVEL